MSFHIACRSVTGARSELATRQQMKVAHASPVSLLGLPVNGQGDSR